MAKNNKRARSPINKSKSPKVGADSHWWQKPVPLVATIAAIVAIIYYGTQIYDWYWSTKPDFDVRWNSMAVYRSDSLSVPEASFSMSISNKSAVSQTIRLDKLKLNYYSFEHSVRSKQATVDIPAHSTSQVEVHDTSLFFDTLLSLPIDSETADFSLTFQCQSETITARKTPEFVRKCLFIQSPSIDPSTLTKHLTELEFEFFIKDSVIKSRFAVGNPTAPFIELHWRGTGLYMEAIDSTIFYPRFGGTYFYNRVGYRPFPSLPTPKELFEGASRYQISKMIRELMDPGILDSKEFIWVNFSSVAVSSPLAERKLLLVQRIFTRDTLDNQVRCLRDSLEGAGFRVRVAVRSLSEIVGNLQSSTCLDTNIRFHVHELMVASAPLLNTAITLRNIVVLDFMSATDTLTDVLTKSTNRSNKADVIYLRLPQQRIPTCSPFMDYMDSYLSRVYLVGLRDTIIVDRSIGKAGGTDIRLRIGSKDSIDFMPR
jgi:hypothetical protein